MARYIDAELLKEKRNLLYLDGETIIVCKQEHIDNVPTADVKEVVRGEWAMKNDGSLGLNWFDCSICGRFAFNNSDFCPNCGADMRNTK